MSRIATFRQFLLESSPSEDLITVYRGIGRNVAEGENEGFLWVATSRSAAIQYAAMDGEGNFNVIEKTIARPKNVFKFNYRTNVHVRATDLEHRLIALVSEHYEDGRISEQVAQELCECIEEFVQLAGNEMEYYHTKINKPGAAGKLAHLFRTLGYDAIQIDEKDPNGEPVPAYGLLTPLG